LPGRFKASWRVGGELPKQLESRLSEVGLSAARPFLLHPDGGRQDGE